MKLTKDQKDQIDQQKLQSKKTKRVVSEALESILYDAIPVLDHIYQTKKAL